MTTTSIRPPVQRPVKTGMLLVLALVASVLFAPSAGAAPKDKGPKVKTPAAAKNLQWSPCYKQLQQDVWPDEFADQFGGPIRFECASLPVPLDYDGPDGGSIQLRMVRIPARDQDNRIGSLFTNPGGPGGSGIEFALFAGATAFGPEVRDQFDIIGFDPRGIVLSTAARCFANDKKAQAAASTSPPPSLDESVPAWLEADATLRAACAKKGKRILDHMSTANVARDLDVMRQAVGDDQLNFVGFSYGSMVGATYANLFPENVRAVALDSSLDPVDWTTGNGDGSTVPVTARLESAKGAQDSLEAFFALCDAAGPESCPIAPDAEARFAAVAAALEETPVTFEFPIFDENGEFVGVESFEYTYDFFIADVASILYDSEGWPIISFIVADVEVLLAGGPPPMFEARFANDITALRAGEANSFEDRAGLDFKKRPNYFNFLEGFPGVLCADSDNPSSIDAWPAAADALDETSYFGSFWTYAGSVCFDWPFEDEDRYAGPWDAVTANPVLILNNEYDPATALEDAIAMDQALGNSQLVVVDEGRGHIAVQGSQCAVAVLTSYLVDLALPPAGFACTPTTDTPFEPAGPPALLALIAPLDGVGEPIEVILIPGPTPDLPPIALDPATGEPLNIDPETGDILPVEIIEILGEL